MYSQPEKSKSNKSGRTVVNDIFQRQTSSLSTLQFTDNRPETIAQKKRYQMVNGNGVQAMFQSPISGTAVIHLPASPQVIQCLRLPRFKDENAAIIYFEDSLLDNLDENYEKNIRIRPGCPNKRVA